MRAISSMATRHLLADLAQAATVAGLGELEIESVGGVDAERRIVAGEPFDLVFLAEGALRRLAESGRLQLASLTPLVVSPVAVAVPSGDAGGATRPAGTAFADASGVRAAMRAAGRIGYSTGPSGSALLRMVGSWGLDEELAGRLVQAPAGVPVAALLAEGGVDLGFQQLSELVGQPGVRILGTLPPDCAIDTVFAGAILTTAEDASRGQRLLAFLASDAVASIKLAQSFRIP